MKFIQSTAEQRSPEWFAERAGKSTASRLSDLMDTLKNGNPSQKQKDYLLQLAFERKYNTVFEFFETSAMREGVYFEDFAKEQFAKSMREMFSKEGLELQIADSNAWVSDLFVASPDGLIVSIKEGAEHVVGIVEIKILGDKSYSNVVQSGIPTKYLWQMQGQMLATNTPYGYFIAMHIKTRKFTVIRVERNQDMIDRIIERVSNLVLPELQLLPEAFEFDFTEADLLDYNKRQQQDSALDTGLEGYTFD